MIIMNGNFPGKSGESDLLSYCRLKERDLRREGIIIVEGRYLVERLLRTDWPLLSVVCIPELSSHFCSLMPDTGTLVVKTHAELEQITGFSFHRGVLAACSRPAVQAADSVLRNSEGCVVVLPHTTDAENMGSIIRSALAFGIQAVFTGRKCCDPFSRKAIRCSMGAVFRLPVVNLEDEAEFARLLRAQGYQLTGAVLSPRAQSLTDFPFPDKTALIIGNEDYGLTAAWETCCNAFIKIPITAGVDSLNAGVAAGIVFYEWQKSCDVRNSEKIHGSS